MHSTSSHSLSISQLQTKLQTLSNSVTSNTDKIYQHSQSISQLQTQLPLLSNSVTLNTDKRDQHSLSISQLQNTTANLESSVSTNTKDISDLELNNTILSTSFDVLTSNLRLHVDTNTSNILSVHRYVGHLEGVQDTLAYQVAELNNGNLDNLTLNTLTVNSNFNYQPTIGHLETIDGTSYRKVLVKSESNAEWVSVSNVFGSLNFTEVNRVDLVDATTIRTHTLDVFDVIQFDDGHRDYPTKIPHGCLISSDNSAHMHWDNKLRTIKREDDNSDKIGFQFVNTAKVMVFYQENGQMIIGESLCNVITPKHIFR